MTSKLMQKVYQVQAEGFLNHYKRELADAHGGVTISKIGLEAVGILVLIVILILIPTIGNAIQEAMPDIETTSAWATFTEDAANLYGAVSPIITVCVLVCLVGLVLKVIFDLRAAKN